MNGTWRSFCIGLSLTLASSAAVPSLAASPIAEIICAPRVEMLNRLERQFGAVRQGMGLSGPDRMVEVWATERSGDWTLVMTYPDGQSCIVAMGEDWETLRPLQG